MGASVLESASSNILRRSGFFPSPESAGHEEGTPTPPSAPSPPASYSSPPPGPSYASFPPSAGSPSSIPRPRQWYDRYRYWSNYQERVRENGTSSRPSGYQSFARYPSKVPVRAPENILSRPYPTKAVPARSDPLSEAIPTVRNPSLGSPASVGRYPANIPTEGSPHPGRVPPGSPQGATGNARGPSYPLGWSMSSLVNKVYPASPSPPPPPPPPRSHPTHSSSSPRLPFLPTLSTPSTPPRPYHRPPYSLAPPPSPQTLSRRMFLSAEDSQTSGRDVAVQRKLEGPSLLEIVKSGIAAAAAAFLVNASTAYLTSGESWHSSGTGRGAGRGVREAETSLVTEDMVSRFLPREWEDQVIQVSEGALLGSDCRQWACGRDDVLTR
ncbi:leucine-rich repeat extensin-like protein 5 [Penaeus monodon]|uniref:leucine-rich repeat extensin-like protein 5 n=1 Tax=Penaeus monodon TaxID=6687 RepID=UPI0018A75D07|nr:leucine-rich repeat extensin-like protein 5 [Penaeus monodon]